MANLDQPPVSSRPAAQASDAAPVSAGLPAATPQPLAQTSSPGAAVSSFTDELLRRTRPVRDWHEGAKPLLCELAQKEGSFEVAGQQVSLSKQSSQGTQAPEGYVYLKVGNQEVLLFKAMGTIAELNNNGRPVDVSPERLSRLKESAFGKVVEGLRSAGREEPATRQISPLAADGKSKQLAELAQEYGGKTTQIGSVKVTSAGASPSTGRSATPQSQPIPAGHHLVTLEGPQGAAASVRADLLIKDDDGTLVSATVNGQPINLKDPIALSPINTLLAGLSQAPSTPQSSSAPGTSSRPAAREEVTPDGQITERERAYLSRMAKDPGFVKFLKQKYGDAAVSETEDTVSVTRQVSLVQIETSVSKRTGAVSLKIGGKESIEKDRIEALEKQLADDLRAFQRKNGAEEATA